MATAYVEWEDGTSSSLEDYEEFLGLDDTPATGEEVIMHPLGFRVPSEFATPDENGAVI